MSALAGRRTTIGADTSRVVIAVSVLALAELVLLTLWQSHGYWDFSQGVYAMSAREWLHGLVPYRQVALAQPPPVVLAGAALLGISDTLTALQVGLGLLDAVTAVLVAVCVWRLCERTWPALVAGALAPLLPISLAAHAQLLPETLAAPLILGGALLCARDRTVVIGALLLAIASWCKLAFLVPAAAIALCAPRRWLCLTCVIGGLAVLFAGSLAAFGTDLYRETITAQLQTGNATVHYVGGLIAQVVWNELPLLFGAILLGWLGLRRTKPGHERTGVGLGRTGLAATDEPLGLTVTAAAVGGLALVASLFKHGSYIDVMVVAEPPLLVLGVWGALAGWTALRRMRWVIVLAVTLLAAQSASLLVDPGHPWASTRPFARSGLQWVDGPGAVARLVAAARACPVDRAYSGAPFIAFLAGRRMPGEQPDLFIIGAAPINRGFAAEAAADRLVCP